MAFLILGRSAIFIISAGLFIQSFGLIIIFFNVFGATASTVYIGASGYVLGDEKSMFAEPTVWIVGLAVLLFPSILMKELAELKIVSLSLFAAALTFVVINIATVFIQGTYTEPGEVQFTMPQEFGSKDFIQSIVVMFTACNFQVNLFPIHSH